MKSKLLNAFKFIAFFAMGVVLFWYLYRDLKIEELVTDLAGVKYEWIFLSIILGLLSHFSRALRWKILIGTLGYKPSTANAFLSVMVAYVTNLAIPRLGEVTRPTIVKRYENIPYTHTFGTIVVERIIDLIMLGLLTLLVFFLEFNVLKTFINNNPDVNQKVTYLLKIGGIGLGAGLIALLAFLIFFRKRLRHFAFYQKIKALLISFYEGLATIKKLKNPFWFIFHTFFIWFMYYMMLYVCFFAFGFTEHLGLMAGLSTFVIASYGMVAPIQGGMGAWHFMVIGTLLVFNIDFNDAKFFALMAHGSQTLMILLAGTLSFMLLPIVNKKKNGQTRNPSEKNSQ